MIACIGIHQDKVQRTLEATICIGTLPENTRGMHAYLTRDLVPILGHVELDENV